MIELIEGLPDGVVGLEAVGKVSSADYAAVANPAVERALAQHGKIRLLHILGDRFTGYTAGGMWDDAKLGLTHPRSWERIAVVTAPPANPHARRGRWMDDSRGDEAFLERGTRRGGGVGERGSPESPGRRT